MNRHELERELLRLGASVEPIPGTGEVLYKHPLVAKWVRVNRRRKDATKASEVFLRKLRNALAGTRGEEEETD